MKGKALRPAPEQPASLPNIPYFGFLSGEKSCGTPATMGIKAINTTDETRTGIEWGIPASQMSQK